MIRCKKCCCMLGSLSECTKCGTPSHLSVEERECACKKPKEKQKHTIIDVDFIESNSEKVKKLAQIGCTKDEIAYILGVSRSSLKHFEDEMNGGLANLKSSIRKAQVEVGLKEKNVQMLLWLGKQFLGQREPPKNIEHSGSINIKRVVFSVDGEDEEVGIDD